MRCFRVLLAGSLNCGRTQWVSCFRKTLSIWDQTVVIELRNFNANYNAAALCLVAWPTKVREVRCATDTCHASVRRMMSPGVETAKRWSQPASSVLMILSMRPVRVRVTVLAHLSGVTSTPKKPSFELSSSSCIFCQNNCLTFLCVCSILDTKKRDESVRDKQALVHINA